MPSFDIVSKVDMHELQNAIDQTHREINQRYDFKGSPAKVEQNETEILLIGNSEFQIDQITDILYKKLAARGIDIGNLDAKNMEKSGMLIRQKFIVRQGIDKDIGRNIIKQVKEKKLKVQAAIQGDQVRVTGKNRDDLQTVIVMLKSSTLELPLQYVNFRD